MIVSTKSLKISPKATPIGRRSGHVGSVYTVGKKLAELGGYARDIKPFLPETYIDRYSYKPRKRLAGYVGQTIHKKRSSTYDKFGKTRRRLHRSTNDDNRCFINSKGSYCTE